MIRYAGPPLPPNPRIAVIANDAIGNFVMATPLLQMLRWELDPCRIHYFGGGRTRELQEASDLFEAHSLLQGSSAPQVRAILDLAGTFDLLVNLESTPFSKTIAGLLAGDSGQVCGPCMGKGGRGELPYPNDPRGDLWRDKEWIAEGITSRYPFLRSGFISEIFARLCYLEGELCPYRVPIEDPIAEIPPILIATAASLPEKLWPLESWRAVLQDLKASKIGVGLLGAPPAQQAEHWKGASLEDDLVMEGLVRDLRGAFSLPQVTGALSKCRAVLTLDNGILHLAAASGTPTIGLYRHGIHRLWAPPFGNVEVMTPGEGRPVSEISPALVLERLQSRLV